MAINFLIFQVIVLLFSAILHEYMHGWMADQLGDTTAKDAGRLTLNPLPHIDPFGSVFLPLLLLFTSSPFVFGWAKPVPFDPRNLRDRKYGSAKVAFAGPFGNLIVALFFGLALRFLPLSGNELLGGLLAIVVQINLLLMIFNLVPIPPLDGSKVIAPFLPVAWQDVIYRWEHYGMFLVIFFVMFGFGVLLPAVNFLFGLITGIKAL